MSKVKSRDIVSLHAYETQMPDGLTSSYHQFYVVVLLSIEAIDQVIFSSKYSLRSILKSIQINI